MAEQYISIKVILDKIHRHPLLVDISLETSIDYMIDFIRLIGVPTLFTTKTTFVLLNDYKALLPDDFVDLIQIRKGTLALRHSTDTFHTSNSGVTSSVDDTFIIQNSYIHSNIEKGDIEISYKAIATDEFGMPLIPDSSSFTRALIAYIKLQHFSILFDLGKININVLTKAQQEYAFAAGAAETDALRLNLSKAESFFNSYRTLIIRDNEFKRGWINDGHKEILKG